MNSLLNKWFTLLSATLLTTLASVHIVKSEEPVAVWSYYNYPPFMVGEKQGLVFDLVDVLNNFADGKFQFAARILPRNRIDKYIADGRQAIIPFVHWSYMQDKDKTKYLWTPTLMNDQNEFVSRISSPVNFDGNITSLHGLRFGAVLGHRYVELEEATTSGKITRVDTKATENALLMLLAGRIDFTSMSKPVLDYYMKKHALKEKVHISKTPRVKYTRHFMVTKGLEQEFQFLKEFMDASADMPEWQDLLRKHGY